MLQHQTQDDVSQNVTKTIMPLRNVYKFDSIYKLQCQKPKLFSPAFTAIFEHCQ